MKGPQPRKIYGHAKGLPSHRQRRGPLGALALSLALVAPLAASAQAPTPVDQAYARFTRGDFQGAYDLLIPYRQAHGGSLRVDFMLGVSGCRIGETTRPWGLRMLKAVRTDYAPLSVQNAADVDTQIAGCQPAAAARHGGGARTTIVMDRRKDD